MGMSVGIRTAWSLYLDIEYQMSWDNANVVYESVVSAVVEVLAAVCAY